MYVIIRLNMKMILAISAGGILGSLARYYLSVLFQKMTVSPFPVGTLIVNLTGCFLIGFVMKLSLSRPSFPIEIRLFLVTGFAGAYTTFSTFEYETLNLIINNEIRMALANVFLSNVTGLAAVYAGSFAASGIVFK